MRETRKLNGASRAMHEPVDWRAVTMKTGERVRNLGLYASSCCMEEVLLDVNDRFSGCSKCECFCSWNLVERVYSLQELEQIVLETLAA